MTSESNRRRTERMRATKQQQQLLPQVLQRSSLPTPGLQCSRSNGLALLLLPIIMWILCSHSNQRVELRNRGNHHHIKKDKSQDNFHHLHDAESKRTSHRPDQPIRENANKTSDKATNAKAANALKSNHGSQQQQQQQGNPSNENKIIMMKKTKSTTTTKTQNAAAKQKLIKPDKHDSGNVQATPIGSTTIVEEEEKQHQEQHSQPPSASSSPQIAWLLSFPNSGTSYTMTNVQHMTGHLVASNYAKDMPHAISLDATAEHGPFYKQPQHPHPPIANHTNQTSNNAILLLSSSLSQQEQQPTLPTTYIMTKTHCAGYCALCGPKVYVVPTVHDFEHGCRTVSMPPNNNNNQVVAQLEQDPATTTTTTTTTTRKNFFYDTPIARAIHLIRHPLDNIVSRMHLALRNHRHQDLKLNIVNLPTEREQLLAWCDLIDTMHEKSLQHAATQGLLSTSTQQLLLWNFSATRNKTTATNDTMSFLLNSSSSSSLLNTIPFCRVELFRYVQWHSRVLEMVEKLQFPVHTVYYESYSTHYNATVNGILEFLKQSPHDLHHHHHEEEEDDEEDGSMMVKPIPFVANKTYVPTLFTRLEQDAMKAFIQTLATPDCWALLQHYFVGL